MQYQLKMHTVIKFYVKLSFNCLYIEKVFLAVHGVFVKTVLLTERKYEAIWNLLSSKTVESQKAYQTLTSNILLDFKKYLKKLAKSSRHV